MKILYSFQKYSKKIYFLCIFQKGVRFLEILIKIIHMKNAGIIGIVGGIGIVIILGIVFLSSQESEIIFKDEFGNEIESTDVEKKLQEKLDEIGQIANNTDYKPLEREWQTSGPFQIDRNEYAIGEKIFIRIGGLAYNEIGQIEVMRPLNATHYSKYISIPFSEAKKSGFNYYLEPQISKIRGICSVDDMTGEWVLIFRGTNYENLNFEITERVVPGTDIETVC